MGDIKRKQGKFRKPRKPFDKQRLEEEKVVVRDFGLKNKKEIRKAEAEIAKIRRRAKTLIPKSEEEKKVFFEKLGHLGFKIGDISDVLALTKENWLNRRLQTFVFKKGFANSINQARQLIVHKKVFVGENIVNIPSFIITKDLENKISLKPQKIKAKPKKQPVAPTGLPSEEVTENGEAKE